MQKILITEDSAYMRRVVTKMVAKEGYQVIEAVDGDDCLRKIASERPDLLLLDLVMPGRNGIAVLGILAKENTSLPVIVLTADIQDSVRRGCLDLGVKAFLNKPPKHDELLSAIHQVFNQKQVVIEGSHDSE